MQVLQPLAGNRGHGNDRCTLQKGGFEKLTDVLTDQVKPIGIVQQIDLGEHDQSLFDTEQLADFQVFPGLGHDALVGGNHQCHQINPGGSGNHVLDKALMAGNIDNPQKSPGGQVEVRKTQLNGDASELFLLQAIGVNAGQSSNEGCLAMIDVSRGTQYDLLHAFSCILNRR